MPKGHDTHQSRSRLHIRISGKQAKTYRGTSTPRTLRKHFPAGEGGIGAGRKGGTITRKWGITEKTWTNIKKVIGPKGEGEKEKRLLRMGPSKQEL